jgi:hypothetical protein
MIDWKGILCRTDYWTVLYLGILLRALCSSGRRVIATCVENGILYMVVNAQVPHALRLLLHGEVMAMCDALC